MIKITDKRGKSSQCKDWALYDSLPVGTRIKLDGRLAVIIEGYEDMRSAEHNLGLENHSCIMADTGRFIWVNSQLGNMLRDGIFEVVDNVEKNAVKKNAVKKNEVLKPQHFEGFLGVGGDFKFADGEVAIGSFITSSNKDSEFAGCFLVNPESVSEIQFEDCEGELLMRLVRRQD